MSGRLAAPLTISGSGASNNCQAERDPRVDTAALASPMCEPSCTSDAEPLRRSPTPPSGNSFADVPDMPTQPMQRAAERLWTAPDGTTCILATCDTPPVYLVSLIRDSQVLRERRLYGLASAQMLAQGWKEAVPLPPARVA